MRYITNAFSLAMLANLPRTQLGIELIPASTARELARDAVSAVGHASTAEIFSEILGLPIKADRRSVRLNRGDSVIVGQYSGPRLPEGATSLPEGAAILWYEVTVL